MSLFNHLKNLFKIKPTDLRQFDNSGNLFYIHEDDAGQIELLPAENLEYLLKECKKIGDFSNEHFDGNGWTDIYIRPEPPKKMADKFIFVADFKKSFFEKDFIEKELRFSGMKKVPIKEFALIKGKLIIYCGFIDDFMNSVYFDSYISEEDLTLFNSILFDLSNKYDLVLADWHIQEIFDTRVQTEIERYHNAE